MSSKNDDLGIALFGLGFGVYGFFWGFKRLRRKRLIENIPTSKIRSLALGLVELIGHAQTPSLLSSPLTKTPCVYYRYLIERYQQSGRSSRWVKVAAGSSKGVAFWLKDETAAILVFPAGAEIEVTCSYKFTSGWQKPIPADLKLALSDFGIAGRGLFGDRALRFSEWLIRPGEEVYVLGTAKQTRDEIPDNKQSLNDRLREIKKNPKKMSAADTNQDGAISQEEWDDFVGKIETELTLEQIKNSNPRSNSDIVVAKGDAQRVFIISNKSQKVLTSYLGFQAVLGVYLGPLLALTCLWYLIWRIGALGF